MPELRRARAPDVRLIVGSTGSGKTWYAKRCVQRRPRRSRALVWDPKDDHFELPTVTLPELARLALTSPVLRYKPRLVDLDQQFNLFCRIAWAVQVEDPATDCVLLIEEGQKVTRPGVAPAILEPWVNVVELGRVYGFTVVVTTQRPAYLDLGFRGAATFIRCGRLGEEADARAIGGRIGVPHREIQRLPDRWAYVFDGRETQLIDPRGKAVPHVSATG